MLYLGIFLWAAGITYSIVETIFIIRSGFRRKLWRMWAGIAVMWFGFMLINLAS